VTNRKPQLPRPRVILARIVAAHHHRPRTLIGLSSRALHGADRPGEAFALRDILLAADPGEYLPILRAFVEFWPADQADRWPTGDPVSDWFSAHPAEVQRHKEAA